MPGLIQALRDQWASEAGPAWLAEGLDPAKNNWNDEEPFPGLLRDLAARGDLAVAVELAVTAIDQARDPGARKAAIWAAEKLALDYRVPPAALAGVLARQAADSAAGLRALSLLQQLDPVLSTADAVFTVADRPGPDRTADEALACLLQQGDPRASGLLARDLADRPFTLRLTSDSFTGGHGKALTIPFSQELLNAIRDLLAAKRFDLNPRAGLYGNTPAGFLSRNGLIQVLLVLESWGPAAAAAVPEVTSLLRDMPVNAGRVLAAIAGPVPDAVDALRSAAALGAEGFSRIPAATRLHQLTGTTDRCWPSLRSAWGREDAPLATRPVPPWKSVRPRPGVARRSPPPSTRPRSRLAREKPQCTPRHAWDWPVRCGTLAVTPVPS